MLFHDDYIIVEANSNDSRIIEHYYKGYAKYIGFYFQDNKYRNAAMILKNDIAKQVQGFAFDVRPAEKIKDEHKCYKNGNKQLEEMIYSCREDITLRELTREERAKIEQYKGEQKGKFQNIKTAENWGC